MILRAAGDAKNRFEEKPRMHYNMAAAAANRARAADRNAETTATGHPTRVCVTYTILL